MMFYNNRGKEMNFPKFTNATTIPYKQDLQCGSCIRGGYDFCSYLTLNETTQNVSVTSSSCNVNPTIPEANVTDYVSLAGYICSNYMQEQPVALVSQCNATHDRPVECGEYLFDLSANNTQQSPEHQIAKMTVGQTCTYRLFSTCGYPGFAFIIGNSTMFADFDILLASNDGLRKDLELSPWDFEVRTRWGLNF